MRAAAAPAVLAVAPALLAAVAAGCGGSAAVPSSPPSTSARTASPSTAARPPALCGRPARARHRPRGRPVGQRAQRPRAQPLAAGPAVEPRRLRRRAGPLSGCAPTGAWRRARRSAARRPSTGRTSPPGRRPNGRPLLYVGDIGDNASRRASIDVYRVPEPRVGAAASAPAARLRLRYPDGAHDAEALLVDPLRGDLVIVTKVLGAARAYRASARLAGRVADDAAPRPGDRRSRSSPPAT